MAIAVILSPKLSLHDLPKPKYVTPHITPKSNLENRHLSKDFPKVLYSHTKTGHFAAGEVTVLKTPGVALIVG